MRFRSPWLLLVILCAAPTARAQDECTPACAGTVLSFCDAGAAVSLDCALLEARCGVLSEQHGADCLLPAGAACDPDYARGASRCDAAAGLACLEGVCAAGSPAEPPLLTPTPGSNPSSTDDEDDDNPFNIPGCAAAGAAPAAPAAGLSWLALLVGLAAVRRRR